MPVRRMLEIKPVRLINTPAGETVFDLGQNMVGWVRLNARGAAGTTIRLRHAEALDKAGNFYTANLRAARQTVTYIMKGSGAETYEPRFTFQGFRYVAVDGYPGTPTLDAVTGIVAYSDLTPTGAFESSNALVNQLQQNIVWGQRGNFLDIRPKDLTILLTTLADARARGAPSRHDSLGRPPLAADRPTAPSRIIRGLPCFRITTRTKRSGRRTRRWRSSR